MRIGILGSGVVGRALAAGFLNDGHEVMIGTMHAERLKDWLPSEGKGVTTGGFQKAADFAEIAVIAIKGTEAEGMLKKLQTASLNGKVVIDVTNYLVTDKMPPTLGIGYPESLGKRIQSLIPNAKVVKAFNTVPANYMTNPELSGEVLDLFIAGDDDEAKKIVTGIAQSWGWNVIDIGRIEQAYLLEALAMLWVRYGFLNNHWLHAFKLVNKG